jgi:hypothetical protein
MWLYNISVRSGKFELFRRWMVHNVPPDRRILLLIVGFSFGALMEGISGFGTPVAICSALLIALGFEPLAALHSFSPLSSVTQLLHERKIFSLSIDRFWTPKFNRIFIDSNQYTLLSSGDSFRPLLAHHSCETGSTNYLIFHKNLKTRIPLSARLKRRRMVQSCGMILSNQVKST